METNKESMKIALCAIRKQYHKNSNQKQIEQLFDIFWKQQQNISMLSKMKLVKIFGIAHFKQIFKENPEWKSQISVFFCQDDYFALSSTALHELVNLRIICWLHNSNGLEPKDWNRVPIIVDLSSIQLEGFISDNIPSPFGVPILQAKLDLLAEYFAKGPSELVRTSERLNYSLWLNYGAQFQFSILNNSELIANSTSSVESSSQQSFVGYRVKQLLAGLLVSIQELLNYHHDVCFCDTQNHRGSSGCENCIALSKCYSVGRILGFAYLLNLLDIRGEFTNNINILELCLSRVESLFDISPKLTLRWSHIMTVSGAIEFFVLTSGEFFRLVSDSGKSKSKSAKLAEILYVFKTRDHDLIVFASELWKSLEQVRIVHFFL